MSDPLTTMDEVFGQLVGETVAEVKIDPDEGTQLLLENNAVISLAWSYWRLDQGQSTVCTSRNTSEWCEETDSVVPNSVLVEPFFENLVLKSIQVAAPGDLSIKFSDGFRLEVFLTRLPVSMDWMIIVDGWRYGLKADLGFKSERYPRELR